jgi:GH15 family glucan-1,4-alpha-glucosidase
MENGAAKIEDYAFLSDTQTGALVSREGCIDWLCLPRFDSPACFASLLGEKKNGCWLFTPVEDIKRLSRRYRGDTLIVETEIETESGAVRLIDFMPPRGKNPDLVRIIEGLRGEVRMKMELIVRFEYGSVIPWVRKAHDGLEAIAGPDGLILRTPVETQGKDLTGPVSLFRSVERRSCAVARHAQRPHLRADRRPGGGVDDFASGRNRRGAQLGLSVLLVA